MTLQALLNALKTRFLTVEPRQTWDSCWMKFMACCVQQVYVSLWHQPVDPRNFTVSLFLDRQLELFTSISSQSMLPGQFRRWLKTFLFRQAHQPCATMTA